MQQSHLDWLLKPDRDSAMVTWVCPSCDALPRLYFYGGAILCVCGTWMVRRGEECCCHRIEPSNRCAPCCQGAHALCTSPEGA